MTERRTKLHDRIEIESSKAAIGMYVAELDRPWLGTPFVFQGFEIKDRHEIELLQSSCSTIFVDVVRSGLTPVQIRALVSASSSRSREVKQQQRKQRRQREPGKWLRWAGNLLRRLGIFGRNRKESQLDDDGYPITASVRSEAGRADDAYKAVCGGFDGVVNFIDKNGQIPPGVLPKVVQPLIESILRNPDAMAWTVFSRRQGGIKHSRSIATSVWCVMFGRQLGLDRDALADLAVGGLLLDIGNLMLPTDLSNYRGELSNDQIDVLRSHVKLGLDILDQSKGISQNIRDMVAHHHERADGSGYPEGLQGSRISAFGRIAAISDAYDAMTTENVYSSAFSAFDVARTLNDMRGNQFDAEVVEQFLRTIGMFPTASVVELNNHSVGLVIEQNRTNALRPKVLLVLDRNHQPLEKPRIVEMRDLPQDSTHANAVWITTGHEHGAFGIKPMDYFNPDKAN